MNTKENIIEDRFLGSFERTGVRMVPRVGDYYACERIPGVAIATIHTGHPREIVRPLSQKGKK